jgi:hypothetical protein
MVRTQSRFAFVAVFPVLTSVLFTPAPSLFILSYAPRRYGGITEDLCKISALQAYKPNLAGLCVSLFNINFIEPAQCVTIDIDGSNPVEAFDCLFAGTNANLSTSVTSFEAIAGPGTRYRINISASQASITTLLHQVEHGISPLTMTTSFQQRLDALAGPINNVQLVTSWREKVPVPVDRATHLRNVARLNAERNDILDAERNDILDEAAVDAAL